MNIGPHDAHYGTGDSVGVHVEAGFSAGVALDDVRRVAAPPPQSLSIVRGVALLLGPCICGLGGGET